MIHTRDVRVSCDLYSTFATKPFPILRSWLSLLVELALGDRSKLGFEWVKFEFTLDSSADSYYANDDVNTP